MAEQFVNFKDVYTCKVSGENYQYEAKYTTGREVTWSARIYQNGELKGSPGGSIIGNVMDGDALRQYIIAYIESVIEKGLGIAE